MRNEPLWLSPEQVVELNKLVVAATGEPYGLRDLGLLESACSKPEQHWHYDRQDDVAFLAATLLFGIAQNHPFVQGNKRTGFEAAVAFLKVNGWALQTAFDDQLGELIIQALADDSRRSAFADQLGDMIAPL